MRGVSAGQIVRDQPGVKEQVGVYLDESVISLSLFTPDSISSTSSASRCCAVRRGRCSAPARCREQCATSPTSPSSASAERFARARDQPASTAGAPGGNVKLGVQRAARRQGGAARGVVLRSARRGLHRRRAAEPVASRRTSTTATAPACAAAVRIARATTCPSRRASSTSASRRTAGTAIDIFNILANPYTTTRPAVTLGDREQFTQIEEPYTDDFVLADVNIDYDFGGLTSRRSRRTRTATSWSCATPTALTASITGGTHRPARAGLHARRAAGRCDHGEGVDAGAALFRRHERLPLGGRRLLQPSGSRLRPEPAGPGFEDLVRHSRRSGLRAPKDVLFFSDLGYKLNQFALFGEGTLR